MRIFTQRGKGVMTIFIFTQRGKEGKAQRMRLGKLSFRSGFKYAITLWQKNFSKKFLKKT
jgi:hypothetical protein